MRTEIGDVNIGGGGRGFFVWVWALWTDIGDVNIGGEVLCVDLGGSGDRYEGVLGQTLEKFIL